MKPKKNRNNSRKLNKLKNNRRLPLIAGASILGVLLLAVLGCAVYNSVIVPKMVEPAIQEAVDIMSMDKYTATVVKELRRLYEAGQVSGSDVEEFLERNDENVADYIPGAVYKGKTDSQTDSFSEKYTETKTDTSDKLDVQNDPMAALGIHSVNVTDESTDGDYSPSGSTYSESASANTDDTSENPSTTVTPHDLYEKAKKIMTAEDYATAMSIGSKIDIAKAKSLLSDSQAFAEYIQSTLTPSEYSTALTIYAKYANELLN